MTAKLTYGGLCSYTPQQLEQLKEQLQGGGVLQPGASAKDHLQQQQPSVMGSEQAKLFQEWQASLAQNSFSQEQYLREWANAQLGYRYRMGRP